jgi:carbohydrate-selective porin OprB
MKRTLTLIITLCCVVMLSAQTADWQEKIQFSWGATGLIQSSIGYQDSTAVKRNIAETSISYDLEANLPFSEFSSLNAHVQGGKGAGIDKYIASYSASNGDAYEDEYLKMTELWIENHYQLISFKSGFLSMGADFDGNAIANSETEQFLNPTFINNPSLEFPADNGLGAIIKFTPSAWVTLAAGAAEADADWDKPFSNDFFITELDLSFKLKDKAGNYRFYGWSNGMDKDRLDGNLKRETSNSGYGLSIDQELPLETTLFARWGRQKDTINEIATSFSGGILIAGNSWGREDDALGLAIGTLGISDKIDNDDESSLEAYYSAKLQEHISLSPDFQMIFNPYGDANSDPVYIWGARIQISF